MSYINIFFSQQIKQQRLLCIQDLHKIFSILGVDFKKVQNLTNLFIFLNINCISTSKNTLLFFIFLKKTFSVTNVCLMLCNSPHQVGFFHKIIPFSGKLKNFIAFSTQYTNNIFESNVVSFNKVLVLSPRHNSTSVDKFLSINSLKDIEFQFLRKNRVFNKGRYSRCRQNYRLGIYLCMYLSIVSIFGMYF